MCNVTLFKMKTCNFHAWSFYFIYLLYLRQTPFSTLPWELSNKTEMAWLCIFSNLVPTCHAFCCSLSPSDSTHLLPSSLNSPRISSPKGLCFCNLPCLEQTSFFLSPLERHLPWLPTYVKNPPLCSLWECSTLFVPVVYQFASICVRGSLM